MRVRQLDQKGDMAFGAGSQNYFIDSAQGVAQVAKTRLMLWLGQWFLNQSDGTPWYEDVLGFNTQNLRDAAIRARLAGTPGVTAILAYQSQLNQQTRAFTVEATLATIYGQTTVTVP